MQPQKQSPTDWNRILGRELAERERAERERRENEQRYEQNYKGQ